MNFITEKMVILITIFLVFSSLYGNSTETYVWIGKGFLEPESKIFSENLNIDYIEILIYPENLNNLEYINSMNEFANSVNPDSKIVLQLCYFLGGNNSNAKRKHNIYDYLFDPNFKKEFNERLINFFDKLTFSPDYFRLGSFDCDSFGCTGWELSKRSNQIFDDYVFPWNVRRNFKYMNLDHKTQFRNMSETERINRIKTLYHYAILGLNEYSNFIKSIYPNAKFIWTIQTLRTYNSIEYSPYEFLNEFENPEIFMSIDYGRINHNIETANILKNYIPPNSKSLILMNGGVWGNRHLLNGDQSVEFCLERYSRLNEINSDIMGFTLIDGGNHKGQDKSIWMFQSVDKTLWNAMLESFKTIKNR